MPPASAPRGRMNDTRFRVLAAIGVALAVGAMALAVAHTKSTDDPAVGQQVPRDVVEALIPYSGASVIRQQEIGIDLTPGYEGTLIVNGTEIPADQERIVPEQNQVFFTPGEGKAVEQLTGGRNCVTAIAWKSSVGRGVSDVPVTWCFTAT